MDKNIRKQRARVSRKHRVRKKIYGTPVRPRLTVYRSLKHVYAQVVLDTEGRTLCQASSLDRELKGKLQGTSNKEAARLVGELIAERAKKAKIQQVVFDRNGYLYHGRIKALADGARGKGLIF